MRREVRACISWPFVDCWVVGEVPIIFPVVLVLGGGKHRKERDGAGGKRDGAGEEKGRCARGKGTAP